MFKSISVFKCICIQVYWEVATLLPASVLISRPCQQQQQQQKAAGGAETSTGAILKPTTATGMFAIVMRHIVNVQILGKLKESVDIYNVTSQDLHCCCNIKTHHCHWGWIDSDKTFWESILWNGRRLGNWSLPPWSGLQQCPICLPVLNHVKSNIDWAIQILGRWVLTCKEISETKFTIFIHHNTTARSDPNLQILV